MTEMRTGGTDTASPTPPAEGSEPAGRTRKRRWRTGSTSTGIKRPRDWEWRRRIRANPQSLRIYRIVIATIGFVIVAVAEAVPTAVPLRVPFSASTRRVTRLFFAALVTAYVLPVPTTVSPISHS